MLGLMPATPVGTTNGQESGAVSANIQLVEDFVAALNAKDVDKILSFWGPKPVYHNMPGPPVKGTEAVRGLIPVVPDARRDGRLGDSSHRRIGRHGACRAGRPLRHWRQGSGPAVQRRLRHRGRQDRGLARLLRHGHLAKADGRAGLKNPLSVPF